jgi:hypothetical protein
MNTRIYSILGHQTVIPYVQCGSIFPLLILVPLDSLEGNTPGENHYLLSLHDVPSVGPGTPPARGYVSGHHLASHRSRYRRFSWCRSLVLSHCIFSSLCLE